MTPLIPSSERTHQVRFYQLIQLLLTQGPFPTIEFNADGLRSAQPGFLETFDFNGVDTDWLFDFITVESRHSNRISLYSEYCYHKQFVTFEGERFSEELPLENCPILFDSVEVYDTLGWVVTSRFGIKELWFSNLKPTGLRAAPDYADLGKVDYHPISSEWVLFEEFDRTNGAFQVLYEQRDGKVERVPIDTHEKLDFIMSLGHHVGIESVTEELAQDSNAILKILHSNGMEFINLSQDAKRNIDYIEVAVCDCPGAFQSVPNDLRADRSLVLRLLEINGEVLKYAAPAFIHDRALALAAVRQSYTVYNHLNPDLQNDPEFLLLYRDAKKAYYEKWDEDFPL